jgi:hypothetical protein
MSFFKSNTTTTTNTAATETTETSNNNGGLLKGLAIGIGTVAGIGAVYFGHKVYKSHHVVADENNLEDVNVDDGEGCENVTENSEPVDKHAKTEELVNQLTEEASKCASIKTSSSIISSIKKMDEMVGSVASMYRTIGDNAKIDSAIAELYKAFNSYWNNLDVKISNCDKEAFVACASEIDAVNNAWWDMQYIQMNRIATETMSYVINKYAHMERVAKRKEKKAALAAETQAAQKSSDETQAEEKKSVGETKTADNAFDVFKDGHKESNKVEHETKSSTKDSDKKQTKTKTSKTAGETKIGNSEVLSDDGETVTLKASVSEDSVQNVMDVIDIVSKIPNREDPEKNDMPYYIRVIGGRIAGITEPEATFLAYNDKTKSNDFIDACVSLCNMVGTGICNLADQKSNPIGSLGWINRSYDELIASGVIDNTYNPQAMRDALTKARNEATRVLTNMVKKSDETEADNNKVTGETKTVTNEKLIDEIKTYVHEINVMAFKDFTMVSTDSFVEKIHKIDECISLLDNSKQSKAIKRTAYKNINITVRLFCTSKLDDIDACTNRIDIVDLCADVRAMLSLNLTNVAISESTLDNIDKAVTSAQNKADEIAAKSETKDLAKASDETQADDKSSGENQTEDTLTYTMSEKIQEAVQQPDETAATAAPEPENQAPMSPEASSLAAKLQEVGELMRAEKWSDASEFYKTQLTPYLADDGLTKELREEIMSIKTKATNMMMSQKQLEAKQKAASAKASKRKSSKRRRH